MTRFVAKAPAKINLGLFLGPPRPDGLHEIVTVTESLSLFDDLTLRPSQTGRDEVFCPGVEGENLALTAIGGFRTQFGWNGPPQRLEIQKRIPVAAGMGGGSADAAAALRLCGLASEMTVEPRVLSQLAFKLGSDVPSQLEPGIALVTDGGGKVERFQPTAEHGVLVVPLGENLSTGSVFKEADRLGLVRTTSELALIAEDLRVELAAGRFPAEELLTNDLQSASVSLYPAITEALDSVRDVGAKHAFVSGSGPTVVGIFTGPTGVDDAGTASFELRDQFPMAVGVVPVVSTQAEARSAEDLCR